MPLACLTDFQAFARERLPKSTWDFIEGGADDSFTRDDNIAAFKRYGKSTKASKCESLLRQTKLKGTDLCQSKRFLGSQSGVFLHGNLEARHQAAPAHNTTNRKLFVAKHRIRLRPRYLKNVVNVDTRTTIQGEEITAPICISPTGFHCLVWPDGEMSTARAAQAAGVCYITSTFATCALEDIAATAPRGLRWFQLYVHPDRQLSKQLVQRVESLGFRALVITVDVPKLGNRRHDIRNQLDLKLNLLLKDLHSPKERTSMPYFQMSPIDSSICWNDLSWLQSITRLPIILKGILTKEDAELAVKHNIHGIIVSNHGGRQLDDVLASIDALAEVVAAVKGKMEVYLDGGIRTGNDVLKALALGAKCVFLGRPILWGLAYKGEDGVKEVLNIIKNEFHTSMALTGCQSVAEINQDMIQFSRL